MQTSWSRLNSIGGCIRAGHAVVVSGRVLGAVNSSIVGRFNLLIKLCVKHDVLAAPCQQFTATLPAGRRWRRWESGRVYSLWRIRHTNEVRWCSSASSLYENWQSRRLDTITRFALTAEQERAMNWACAHLKAIRPSCSVVLSHWTVRWRSAADKNDFQNQQYHFGSVENINLDWINDYLIESWVI